MVTAHKSRNKHSSHNLSHTHHHFPQWLSVLVAIILGLSIIAGVKLIFLGSLKVTGKGFEQWQAGMPVGTPSGEMPTPEMPGSFQMPQGPTQGQVPTPAGTPQIPLGTTPEMCNTLQDPVAVQTCLGCISNPASCAYTPTPIEQDPAQKYCDEYKKNHPEIPKDICGNCILDGRQGRGEECEPPGFTMGYYIAGAKWTVAGAGQPRWCNSPGTKGYDVNNPKAGLIDIGCFWAWCGDGVLNKEGSDVAEECDDGNIDNNDGCSNDCKKPKKCGTEKGEIFEGYEKAECNRRQLIVKDGKGDIIEKWQPGEETGYCPLETYEQDVDGDGDSLNNPIKRERRCYGREKVCCKCLYETPKFDCAGLDDKFCGLVSGCSWNIKSSTCEGGEFLCEDVQRQIPCIYFSKDSIIGTPWAGLSCEWKENRCVGGFKINCETWAEKGEQKICYKKPVPIEQIPEVFIDVPEDEIKNKLGFPDENCNEKRVYVIAHSGPSYCPAFFNLAAYCIEAEDPEAVKFLQSMSLEHGGCSTFGNEKIREEQALSIKEKIVNKLIEKKLSHKFTVSLEANTIPALTLRGTAYCPFKKKFTISITSNDICNKVCTGFDRAECASDIKSLNDLYPIYNWYQPGVTMCDGENKRFCFCGDKPHQFCKTSHDERSACDSWYTYANCASSKTEVKEKYPYAQISPRYKTLDCYQSGKICFCIKDPPLCKTDNHNFCTDSDFAVCASSVEEAKQQFPPYTMLGSVIGNTPDCYENEKKCYCGVQTS